MTEIKEEIPCCENCPTIKCFHHPNHWKTTSQCWSRNDHIQVWEFTKEHGAACHPGARAYLNKDIIKKLETLRDEINVENNNAEQIPDTQGNVNEAMIYVIEEEVIPLLKGGKKNE